MVSVTFINVFRILQSISKVVISPFSLIISPVTIVDLVFRILCGEMLTKKKLGKIEI